MKQSLCNTVCQLGEVHHQKCAPGEPHTERKHNRVSVCLCAARSVSSLCRQAMTGSCFQESHWCLHRPFKWDLQSTLICRSDPGRWSSEIPQAPKTPSPNFQGVSCHLHLVGPPSLRCFYNDFMTGEQLKPWWWGQHCPCFTYCCKDICVRKGHPQLWPLLSLQPSATPLGKKKLNPLVILAMT